MVLPFAPIPRFFHEHAYIHYSKPRHLSSRLKNSRGTLSYSTRCNYLNGVVDITRRETETDVGCDTAIRRGSPQNSNGCCE